MKKTPFVFAALIAALWSGGPGTSAARAADLQDSVVKVYVTANHMDYYRPWQSKGSESTTGSGCLIEGNRILTNAHVVDDSTFIQVRKESDPRRYTARLETIGFDCDLALLTVDDPSFFEGMHPLPLGELPFLQDTVTVIGFPTGGDKISITKGVVSRIEIIPYTLSSKKLLAVQIDAAINPGNSGGPVIRDGQLAGVAMQVIRNSQNIGYMIPMPVIRHFLDDIADGHYDGFPVMGIEFFTTENRSLREYYNVQDQDGGVLVGNVLPFSSAEKVLKQGDILMDIDGVPIGMDGTYEFRKAERLLFSHLMSQKQLGETIRVKIIRNGKALTKDISFAAFPGLVPYPRYFERPPYYIYGGLIFSVLSMDLLRSWGDKWWEQSPLGFLTYLAGNERFNPERKKEVVVLLNVLADDINSGYQDYNNQVIARVNGKSFVSFKDFIRKIEESREPYCVFATDQNTELILKTENIHAITDDIVERYHIPDKASEGISAWLKPAGKP